MNVELLLKVKEAILEEPSRIDMADWVKADDTVPCGTVGCIQGWGVALQTGLRGWDLVAYFYNPEAYDDAFDLTPGQQNRLFYEHEWPYAYWDKLRSYRRQTPEYAQVVADRIDHFIATKGEE